MKSCAPPSLFTTTRRFSTSSHPAAHPHSRRPERVTADTARTTCSTTGREEMLQPFDLAQGPLLRSVCYVCKRENVLLLKLHHIVCDGWSLGILLRELSTLYEPFSPAQPSPLPTLPLQYADYTLWQHQWLHSDSLLSQQAYWLQHLSQRPSVLQLPTDHPRPALQSFQGAHHRFSLPLALSEELKALSQREGGYPVHDPARGFLRLAPRYSGQEDILIGTPIANRQHSQLEALIGCSCQHPGASR